jgi:Family of unknown function (DUF6498)
VRFYRDSGSASSKDYSGIGILISNVVVIAFAMLDGWDLGPLMLIYWAQSVIIGFYHFFRILLLRSFCTEGFTSNGERVPESPAGKRSTALFFAVHYGFFHVVYFIFLAGFSQGSGGGGKWFLFSVLGFLFGHGYSFYQNVKSDLARRPNLGTMMFLPYARILPMHLTIIFGNMVGSNPVSVLLFSILKTGADYLMHIVEHRVLQKKVAKQG